MRTFTNTLALLAVFLAVADHHAVMGEQKIARTALSGESQGESSQRALKSGKGKGIDCVTLVDPSTSPVAPATPAPTKGKGGSKGGKGSKGDGSAAPSYFCSEAPSVAPSTSTAPSGSTAPSLAPAVSKGKGGGKMMMK